MDFLQQTCKSLYLAPNSGDNAGGFAFVVSKVATRRAKLPKRISLKDALTSKTYSGSFIYCPDPLECGGKESSQQDLVSGLHAYLQSMNVLRGFMWLPKDLTPLPVPRDYTGQRPAFFSINAAGTVTTSSLSYLLAPELTIEFYSSAYIGVSEDEENLQLSESAIQLGGYLSPDTGSVSKADIRCSGPDRGAIVFDAEFERGALHDQWNLGFQWVTKDAKTKTGVNGQRFALGTGDNGSRNPLPMTLIVDVTDALNIYPTHNRTDPNRCAFYFRAEEESGQGPTLNSFYRTTYGAPVVLQSITADSHMTDAQSAGIILTPSYENTSSLHSFIASPVGDFLVCAPAAKDDTKARFMCGLGGTEFLEVPGAAEHALSEGARLRFIPNQPAYAPVFPLPVSSPVGRPAPKGAPLKGNYKTSYVQVFPPDNAAEKSGTSITYVAQPHGSALHGYDDEIWQENKELLGTVSPAYTLPPMEDKAFPMFPYAGTDEGDPSYSQCDVALFEKSIIAPTRRKVIASLTNAQSNAREAKAQTGEGDATLTTPLGVIATLQSPTDASHWKEVKLAQIKVPTPSDFAFKDLSPKLIEAFQTNQLFLVAANPSELGEAGSTFLNTLNIEDWQIEADVGNSPDFGDYANILIIKGIRGPLFDPKGSEKDNLISNPQKWTQKETFAAPTTERQNTPDKAQLVNVSSWLQDYFKAAYENPATEYFESFNQTAADPNWTGVLMLRARIKSPPEQLAGIVAGVRDPAKFYAHHLAIRINQIKAGASGEKIEIKKQSSVYGLIYYEDSDLIVPKGATSPEPVVPSATRTYDFILLSLKVLFENSAIKKFSSFAQLSMTRIFGSETASSKPVLPTGQPQPKGSQYKSLIMKASYQDNNNHPSYTMAATHPYLFTVDNNILEQTEFTSARMNTISKHEKTQENQTEPLIRFAFTGFLDFAILSAGKNKPVDLFSFGNEPDQQTSQNGLAFNELGLQMSFAQTSAYESQKITWDSAQLTFDSKNSTPRSGSLVATMPLQLKGFVSSDSAGKTPASMGYLDVVTSVRQQGLSDTWNGLKFEVSLGTAGDLAGKLGLTADLLLAWSPDSTGETYKSKTAIQMPGSSNGASLISLQNVLSMSYGPIQLLYTENPNSKEPDASKQYMFVLNEIAIKFLGLAKIPPSGATSFYLFSDPDESNEGSAKTTGLAWYAVYNNEPADSK
ncbi:hypothetical protein PsAD5_02018 [Pseudovibrio sp. Ad5]|uniref:hypothetical protein n=1 Tax=Pseudovibrio sp. Ad5 TaxID=989436 RepID=UPI0007AE645C|nr:hypothetical protein [Pseudovibrio sp. Ad5]KZK97783.1 hypothetical protein PsAD5_02018 [Pseudovibrio sp. Ad5]